MEKLRHRVCLCFAIIFAMNTICVELRAENTYLKVDTADWTVLVYMNADNNLEPDAIDNFLSMAKVGSTKMVNIIVQFDRIGKYDKRFGGWSQTLRFRVTKNLPPVVDSAEQDLGEVNMGSGKSLQEFADWAIKKYPAKHYLLDIWDHGDGYRLYLNSVLTSLTESRSASPTNVAYLDFVHSSRSDRAGEAVVRVGDPFRSSIYSPFKSCSNDETDNDELFNRKIQSALESVVKKTKRKFDVIGFDCCLMAMVETAYALRNVADFFIGSEELEPGSGWRYDDIMRTLVKNSKIQPSEYSKAIVTSYQRHYQMALPTTTLSAIDLRGVQQAAAKVSNFSLLLKKALDTELSMIKKARANCLHYAPRYTEPNPFYHIDLIRFCEQIAELAVDPTLKKEALLLKTEIKNIVIQNYRGESRRNQYGSYGLAIYFPPSGNAYTTDKRARNGYERSNNFYPVEFVQKEKWTDFLHAYFDKTKD